VNVGDTLTIELPLPPKELSPNARVHWARKADRVKWYRGRAWAEALAAQGRNVRGWKRATVQLTFYRKTRGRIDTDNALASCKALFDGLTDAGVIEDDCGLTHLPVKIDKDKDNPRVVVELTAQG
jgi:crossover junction endodeoxyribonuclease RusA